MTWSIIRYITQPIVDCRGVWLRGHTVSQKHCITLFPGIELWSGRTCLDVNVLLFFCIYVRWLAFGALPGLGWAWNQQYKRLATALENIRFFDKKSKAQDKKNLSKEVNSQGASWYKTFKHRTSNYVAWATNSRLIAGKNWSLCFVEFW